MTLELVEPGLLTLVQAVPYRNTRHLGMPLVGAADPVAMALANWLADNGPEAAALETAYAPVTLRAHQDCVVGIQGAAVSVEVNGKAMPTNQSIILMQHDLLHIPPPAGGCRTYIAVSGGLTANEQLKPTSTYLPAKLGGYCGASIPKGATINGGTTSDISTLPSRYQLRYRMDFLLRIVAAPESDWLDTSSLLSDSRTVSRRADRIGLELAGEPLQLLRNTPIDSSSVFPGTIQCPPSGLPFLLGPDAQTTGGYPRIAQVIRADRHLIGQLRPGARVRFQRIEPVEARRLYRSKIALIRQLQPEFRLD
jgi:5-oxoprolinase (ATP-hydrolysing) subunit C